MRHHIRVLSHFPAGDYRFLPSPGAPFSHGVLADPSFELVRAVFRRPLPLEQGLNEARRHVDAAGRPTTAIGAFELRIPEPLTPAEFAAFNVPYVERLAAMGLTIDGQQPTARTNVAPIGSGVTEPSVFAFTYTVPASGRLAPAFRLSGAVPTTLEGSAVEQLRSVVRELDDRLEEFGVGWSDATAVALYGPPAAPAAVTELVQELGQALQGIVWFPSWPPVRGPQFEIDVRAVRTELIV
jgi:hypothetical protein